jgi:hypothetical protein
MSRRRSVVIIDDFYADPDRVREYALNQQYYLPYQDEDEVKSGARKATWWSSWYQPYERCPFKSSGALVKRLEEAVDEYIDMAHWSARYPVDERSKPVLGRSESRSTCLWNCSFQVKLDTGQQLGGGVHNHVTDGWNCVGPNGWVGVLYLSPDAQPSGGLQLWANIDPNHQRDWMTTASDWVLQDVFANVFNRLVLCRGDMPHSGADGWGRDLASGRMFQTFFFRTTGPRNPSAPSPGDELAS